MAGESTNQNQNDQDPGLLNNDPASQQQQDPNAGGSGQGLTGLTEADVRRIALEVAKPAAQSEAYKAENRINQNVQVDLDKIMNVLKATNPNLKLDQVSPEQIRDAQRRVALDEVADQMLGGQFPQGTAQSAQGGRQPAGSQTDNIGYVKLRLEEVFAEEGESLFAEDPESQGLPDPKTVSTGQMVVEVRKAVQAKKARMATNPKARMAPQGMGAAVGGLVSQYQAEKAKIPRGASGHKPLQELKMKYERMGVNLADLD